MRDYIAPGAHPPSSQTPYEQIIETSLPAAMNYPHINPIKQRDSTTNISKKHL